MNADRKSIAVINPANEEVIGEVPRQTAADADRAVRAAREAFLKWRWVPGIEKAALLHQVAAGIRSKQQDLATIMTREGGKPFCENRDEVEWTAACFDYYGAFGGMRQTGHSRELGEEGLDEFRETKHVHLDYKQEIKPYWYPYSRYNGIKP